MNSELKNIQQYFTERRLRCLSVKSIEIEAKLPRNKSINQVNLKTKAMKAAKVKQVTMIGHHQYGSQGETAYRVVTDTWAGWVIAFGGDYRRATRLEETEITDRIKVNPGTYEEELANGMIGTLVEF
jgi:phage FluMu protein Com